jgi:hypothetical protein
MKPMIEETIVVTKKEKKIKAMSLLIFLKYKKRNSEINSAITKFTFRRVNSPPNSINLPDPPKHASIMKNQKKQLRKVVLFSEE